jgi:hypothetical protein
MALSAIPHTDDAVINLCEQADNACFFFALMLTPGGHKQSVVGQ